MVTQTPDRRALSLSVGLRVGAHPAGRAPDGPLIRIGGRQQGRRTEREGGMSLVLRRVVLTGVWGFVACVPSLSFSALALSLSLSALAPLTS